MIGSLKASTWYQQLQEKQNQSQGKQKHKPKAKNSIRVQVSLFCPDIFKPPIAGRVSKLLLRPWQCSMTILVCHRQHQAPKLCIDVVAFRLILLGVPSLVTLPEAGCSPGDASCTAGCIRDCSQLIFGVGSSQLTSVTGGSCS